jgi:hypothetical protein
VEVDHFIRLSFWYNARGVLYIGVGNQVVASFGRGGVTAVTTGGTVDASTTSPDSFTTITAATGMTYLPVAGDFMNVAPLVTMFPSVGFLNSTANARIVYMDQFLYAGEY